MCIRLIRKWKTAFWVKRYMKKFNRAFENKHGTCCFCKQDFKGLGNSTWPIYYKEDGETHRCCDECNKNIVGKAREDSRLIMNFREQFGIDYTEYEE